MAWRGPRSAPDPQLTSYAWRQLRKYWVARRLPCSLCGEEIDYKGERFFIVNGKRRLNPRYLVVGHIVSRRKAAILGWSEQQTNALSNLRAECQHCSNSGGAREGNQAQRTKQAARGGRVNPSRRW